MNKKRKQNRLKRVCISVDPDGYPAAKEYAWKHYRLPFSTWVRWLIAERMNNSGNSSPSREQGLIIEELNKLAKSHEELSLRFAKLEKGLSGLLSYHQVGLEKEKLRKDIVRVLEESGHPLTTKGIHEKLPQYLIPDILSQLEYLRDHFLVEQICPTSELGETLWRLGGGEDD